MDAAPGAQYVPVSRRILNGAIYPFFLTFLLAIGAPGIPRARAAVDASPLQWSADKTYWDRKTNKVQLSGHAVVRQPGEVLSADDILLDLDNRILDAKGDCNYIAAETVIRGEEMHFNLETRTGSIVGGRVANDRFSLSGQRINKLGEKHFQTHQGSYSTCRDCPNSWNFFAEDVDMEFEGYAYMSNVTGRVQDAPIFWLPYLVVPMKTRRQTGFLFPKFGFTSDGFRYVQPFYWAPSRSFDLTFGAGEYGGRGFRFEAEGRYRTSERSGGQANFYYLNDLTFERYIQDKNANLGLSTVPTKHRWALDLSQIQELPGGVEEKLRLREASDNKYPDQVGDIPGSGEAYLSSDLVFSHATHEVSSFVAMKRTRNLLTPDPREFDPNTVQIFPTVGLTSSDRLFLDGHVAAGITLGVTNFSRSGPAFDRDLLTPVSSPTEPPRYGIDPIRKATRLSYTPRFYTTFRPFDVLSLVPTLEYRGLFYSFHQEVPDLARGYLLVRIDLSTQLERFYETGDPDAPRAKHLIRPLLTYSRIPFVNESYSGKNDPGNTGHPFLKQMEYAQTNGFSGYNFDNYDIVPLDSSRTYSNYFLPQGNALSYGFTTQLIRRRESAVGGDPTYQTAVEFKAGQSYNFRELQQPEGDQQPLSRFFSALNLEYDRWKSQTNYTYVPYAAIGEGQDRNIFSTSFSYLLERSLHQKVLDFERSFNLGFSRSALSSRTSNLTGAMTWSVNDYFMPRLGISRDFLSGRWLAVETMVRFQSPSRCWSFDVTAKRKVCDKYPGFCFDFGVDLSLNLTGSGFGGIGGTTTPSNDILR